MEDKKIGSYEAKTPLPALLRKVTHGQHFTITKQGRPTAKLVPFEGEKPTPAQVIDQIRALRKGITLGDHSLKELIEAGRR